MRETEKIDCQKPENVYNKKIDKGLLCPCINHFNEERMIIMPLVTSTEMFKKAYEGGYAIGAFNVNNMEIVQAITEAAGELNSPIILQVSAGARKYANHTYLVKLVEAASDREPEHPDRSASGSRRRF